MRKSLGESGTHVLVDGAGAVGVVDQQQRLHLLRRGVHLQQLERAVQLRNLQLAVAVVELVEAGVDCIDVPLAAAGADAVHLRLATDRVPHLPTANQPARLAERVWELSA